MTTLSTRPIEHIGFEIPKGIRPEEQFFSNFTQEENDSDLEYDDIGNISENEDEECTTETETTSEISEAEIVIPLQNKNKKHKISKSYTLILQEEEFTPEIFSR